MNKLAPIKETLDANDAFLNYEQFKELLGNAKGAKNMTIASKCTNDIDGLNDFIFKLYPLAVDRNLKIEFAIN